MSYLPLGGLIAIVLAVELAMIGMSWQASPQAESLRAAAMPEGLSNIEALGTVIYDQYVYFFQIAGLVLLVAMIGAIVLTLRHKENVKRQDISKQVARTRETAIEIHKVETGKGI